jgi:hypothetical protein
MTDTVAPRAATGRLTVNPGDTVLSTWGNTTYDQTMEVFDSAAQRDSQWPTPHDGALAYTLDTQTAWVRRSGAWVQLYPVPVTRLPLGLIVAPTAGPVSQTDVQAITGIVTATWNAVQGRYYRICGYGLGTHTASGTGGAQSVIRVRDPNAQDAWASLTPNPTSGNAMAGYATKLWLAAATASVTAQVAGSASGTAVLRFAANSCVIWVEDAGTL